MTFNGGENIFMNNKDIWPFLSFCSIDYKIHVYFMGFTFKKTWLKVIAFK